MSTSTIYFNTAAFGLIDPTLKAAADDFYTRLGKEGSGASEEWKVNSEPNIRRAIAGFVGAKVENIAMLPNFSWGLNAVVQSLSGKERVLLYKGDFPSLLEPFRLNRFDIEWVESGNDFDLPLEEIEALIQGNRVDVVALSHVQYNSGYKLPLERLGKLCKGYGVTFIVDATQSLGAVPIDISTLDVDVLIASNYKWMNAGFGTGIMYISDDFLRKYPPVVGGNNSFTMQDGMWQHNLSARSYEPGHSNMYGLTLLNAAIATIVKLGVENINAHNLKLTQRVLEAIDELGLPLIGPASMANRASFVVLWDKDGLSDKIREGRYVVTNRMGRIRISLHHYNTMEEVEGLIKYLS